MYLIAIGVNHKTASLDLRERVAFGPDKLPVALSELRDRVQGAVIISTCNRTEIYCDAPKTDKFKIIDWLSEFHHVEHKALESSLYVYEDEEAIRHLMRVSCGLDSLVLGETQILGQVKQAYSDLIKHNLADPIMNRLFQRVFSVAKRVRTETDIGGNAVSIAYLACTLAKHIFDSLQSVTVLLVGAGETISLVAKHLVSNECQNLIFANRTREKVLGIANKFGAKTISLPEIPRYLVYTDIVISATGSPLPIISKKTVEKVVKARRSQPMLLVDIAVPRDIEAQVSGIDSVYLYSIDDLQSIVDNNMEQRKVEAIQAEAIVNEESIAFVKKMRSLQAVDSIKEYRESANVLRKSLLAKALRSISSGISPETALQELSHRLTNKLIHAPTQALKVAAEREDSARLAIIRKSIGLEDLS